MAWKSFPLESSENFELECSRKLCRLLFVSLLRLGWEKLVKLIQNMHTTPHNHSQSLTSARGSMRSKFLELVNSSLRKSSSLPSSRLSSFPQFRAKLFTKNSHTLNRLQLILNGSALHSSWILKAHRAARGKLFFESVSRRNEKKKSKTAERRRKTKCWDFTHPTISLGCLLLV